MTRFQVEHVNHYRYAQAVGLNFGEARLLPRDAPGQRVLQRSLSLEPHAEDYRERNDTYGNRVAWFSLRQAHPALKVSAVSVIEREARPLPEDDLAWEDALARTDEAARPGMVESVVSLTEFRLASPFVPRDAEASSYARESFPKGRPVLTALIDLSQRIQADFAYRPNATHIDTPLQEVLRERHGVCQDFAHLALAGLRGLGFAARYVSGYLETRPAEGEVARLGADASHAWISVFVPGHGWLDFDPTNGMACDAGHLTLAWGRDFGDVTPLKGVIYGGGEHTLEVGVTVTRLD